MVVAVEVSRCHGTTPVGRLQPRCTPTKHLIFACAPFLHRSSIPTQGYAARPTVTCGNGEVLCAHRSLLGQWMSHVGCH